LRSPTNYVFARKLMIALRVLLLAFCAAYAQPSFGQLSNTPRENLVVTDGPVFAILITNGIVYIGGSFSNVITGGERVPRTGIAALSIFDGSPTPWNPGALGGEVRALALRGQTLYTGGSFTNVGGQPRSLVAALDIRTGLATSWDPEGAGSPDGYPLPVVYSIALGEERVYVGGEFIRIGSQPRGGIAALTEGDGSATDWNPGTLGPVYALLVAGNLVYAGGPAAFIGGALRSGLAAIDTRTARATSFNPYGATPQPPIPSYSTAIHCLALSDGIIFAGGKASGNLNNGFGFVDAFNVGDGSAKWRWVASPFEATIYALAVTKDTLWAGGQFYAYPPYTDYTNHTIAALNIVTGGLRPWRPALTETCCGPSNPGESKVFALSLEGGSLFVGGQFQLVNDLSRPNLAAFDSLYFLPPQKLRQVSVRFTVNGSDGVYYQIQASTNLANWAELQTTNGLFSFEAETKANSSKGFYRALRVR
jgi:hypothetical protein